MQGRLDEMKKFREKLCELASQGRREQFEKTREAAEIHLSKIQADCIINNKMSKEEFKKTFTEEEKELQSTIANARVEMANYHNLVINQISVTQDPQKKINLILRLVCKNNFFEFFVDRRTPHSILANLEELLEINRVCLDEDTCNAIWEFSKTESYYSLKTGPNVRELFRNTLRNTIIKRITECENSIQPIKEILSVLQTNYNFNLHDIPTNTKEKLLLLLARQNFTGTLAIKLDLLYLINEMAPKTQAYLLLKALCPGNLFHSLVSSHYSYSLQGIFSRLHKLVQEHADISLDVDTMKTIVRLNPNFTERMTGQDRIEKMFKSAQHDVDCEYVRAQIILAAKLKTSKVAQQGGTPDIQAARELGRAVSVATQIHYHFTKFPQDLAQDLVCALAQQPIDPATAIQLSSIQQTMLRSYLIRINNPEIKLCVLLQALFNGNCLNLFLKEKNDGLFDKLFTLFSEPDYTVEMLTKLVEGLTESKRTIILDTNLRTMIIDVFGNNEVQKKLPEQVKTWLKNLLVNANPAFGNDEILNYKCDL